MDSYFKQLPNCILYIDDILLYTKTKEEHLKLLEQFTDVIKKLRISLSEKKPEIMKNQIEFLGIHIDKSGVKMQTTYSTKNNKFKRRIRYKKKLQSFLGLINQVREYIPKLAENLKPLRKKIKKGYRI